MNNYLVGIYLRLSKEDERLGESGSITNQRALLMNYIEEHNLTYIAEYVDDGVSGTTFQRKGFQRMIRDIEQKRINMVITKDTSRLGRDHIEFGYYVEKYFPEHHVRYVAVCDNIDTFYNNNDMLLFKSAYNDMYVKDISNKIRSSLAIKKKNGEFVGAYAPYGYQKNRFDKHKLVIDEEAAKVVRKIFQLFVEGFSITNIADTLTEEQIPIPSIYKGMNRGVKSQLFGIWTQSTVTDILTNPTYMGNLTQGRSKKINYKSKKRIHTKKEDWIVKEDSCPAIIEKDLFERANHRYLSNKYCNSKSQKQDLLLKGFVFCADCNHTIGFRKVPSSQKIKIYGNCNYYLKHRHQNVCTPHSISYSILENIILKEINTYLENTELKKQMLNLKNLDFEKEFKTEERKIISLQKTIEFNHQKLDVLYEDRLNQLIDAEQYLKIKEKIKQENNQLEENIDQLTQRIAKLRSINYQEKVEQLIEKYQVDKELLSILIEKILINERGEIHIYYKARPSL